jgi:ABC-type nitrate/sulfonate/bicarbonate transport system substrate-binding protein
MSEIKHTPGPWSVHSGDDYNGVRIDGPDGRSVAHAHQRDPHPTLGQGITQAEAEINARLIAAAPELLETMQMIMDRAEEWINMNLDGEVGDNARAAIAKATGSQS